MHRLRYWLILVFVLNLGQQAHANERDDAVTEAKLILQMLSDSKSKELWDSHLGSVYQQHTSQQQFSASLAFARSQTGHLTKSEIVGVEFSSGDPNYHYTGKLYAVTFLDTYEKVKLYDRVVVCDNADNVFKLCGLFAAPAP